MYFPTITLLSARPTIVQVRGHVDFTSNYIAIDPMQKWLPLNYSFVHIQKSPTNLVFEAKILKNLLSRARLVGLF